MHGCGDKICVCVELAWHGQLQDNLAMILVDDDFGDARCAHTFWHARQVRARDFGKETVW
jgi:hypothetical protein